MEVVMENERLVKKGRVVEFEEEMAAIQAKTRGYIQALRGGLIML